MATKELTVAEVAAHNTREDLYIIIKDEVYDLSKFAAEVSWTTHQKKYFVNLFWWIFDLDFFCLIFSSLLCFQHPGQLSRTKVH